MIFWKSIIISIWTLTFALIAYGLLLFAPFHWFVDVSSVTYSDVCLGDDTQVVTAEREARWDIEGEGESRLILFVDSSRLETTLTRQAFFVYEEGTDVVSYEVRWSQPLERAGEYGANELIKIKPFPFVYVEQFFPAEEHTFNVINCE